MPVVLVPLHFDRDPALRAPSCSRSVVLRPFLSNDFMTGVPVVPGIERLPLPVNLHFFFHNFVLNSNLYLMFRFSSKSFRISRKSMESRGSCTTWRRNLLAQRNGNSVVFWLLSFCQHQTMHCSLVNNQCSSINRCPQWDHWVCARCVRVAYFALLNTTSPPLKVRHISPRSAFATNFRNSVTTNNWSLDIRFNKSTFV